MAQPTAETIKNNIQAEDSVVWTQADQRPNGLDVFESDLADAIAQTWATVEDGFVIASVPVTGGTSASGGPLQAGIATLSPGSVTNPANFAEIATNFSTSFPEGLTEGLSALVDAVAKGIGLSFPLWVAGYSAILTASGGICKWMAGPPPTPGDWTGGSIEDFPLENGASTGDVDMSATSLEAAIDNAAEPAILKQNENKLQPGLAALVAAITQGFETTWNQWEKDTKISGGDGTGTAIPTVGNIEGGSVTLPGIG